MYNNHIFIFYVAIIIFFASCSHEEAKNPFLIKESQNITDRILIGSMAIKDSLLLYEAFGMINASVLNMDNNNLYIRDASALNKIFVIDKKTFEYKHTISPAQGRGPGEITAIGTFDVFSPYIIITDGSLMKIQIWKTDGRFVNEFILDEISPHRLNMWENERITILSATSSGSDHLFHTIDKDGNRILSFGEISKDNYNPLMYSGSTLTDEEYFYYAGFSEHILKKWDQEGNLEYSIATIDDFPGEANYVTFLSGEQRSFQYTETGYYSAIGFTVYNDYLMILHAGERIRERQLLDFYDKHNGRYLASVELPYLSGSGSIVADDLHIYTLHMIDEEVYLGIYENNLTSLLE
ncbi:MAG: hypothetical protein JJU13_04995 [Balneolaceae bacterium]|nr:hypothetical protein [Balneolaceae bacterium]